eukprot:c11508_g1_i1.p1 GENE.c11508_g1_i1~~c11508_g1_i1.p1  ORF type:complete len:435 (-),score=136.32 c11508_g1_i1:27-1331(-)
MVQPKEENKILSEKKRSRSQSPSNNSDSALSENSCDSFGRAKKKRKSPRSPELSSQTTNKFQPYYASALATIMGPVLDTVLPLFDSIPTYKLSSAQVRSLTAVKTINHSFQKELEKQRLSLTSTKSVPKEFVKTHRIYVGNLPTDTTDHEFRELFSAFGEIANVTLPVDLVTFRQKTFGFVDFAKQTSAEEALKLNGFQWKGRQLKIAPPNQNTTTTTITPPSRTSYTQLELIPIPFRVVIKNVNCFLNETHLESIFKHFGEIKSCTIDKEYLSGNGIIEFGTYDAAEEAIKYMNNYELAEKKIRLSWESPESIAVYAANKSAEDLRQKWDSSKPTRCLLLRNMVERDEVDDQLGKEILEECEQLGKVDRIVIYSETQSDRETNDSNTKIFVFFEDISGSARAQLKLNSRWFAGRKVRAEYFSEKKFLAGDFSA